MIALLILAACAPEALDDDDTGNPEDTGDAYLPDDAAWEAFLGAREGYLDALGEPILACAAREDTTWPAFHGCVDWHSAVHATYALLLLGRLTGDDTYTAAADAVLHPDALALELENLETSYSLPNSEIPYGYAWFLVLARERARGGWDDLAPLAEVATADLAEHAFGLSDAELEQGLRAANYDNLSWELLNLWLEAEATGDTALAGEVEALVQEGLVPLTEQCSPATAADNTGNFFPPCLHFARLVVTVLPAEERQAWLDTWLPLDFWVDPLTQIDSAHQAGLNFSRAWDLYALWAATGEARYRDLYADHVVTHMEMPEYWAEDYDSYAHWVAQFGVYAVGLSFEDPLAP